MIYKVIYIVGIVGDLTNTIDATFGRFSSYNSNSSFIPYSFFLYKVYRDDSDAPPQDVASDIA